MPMENRSPTSGSAISFSTSSSLDEVCRFHEFSFCCTIDETDCIDADTTGVLLTWTFFELSKNPAMLAKVLLSSLSSSSLLSLPFLLMCSAGSWRKRWRRCLRESHPQRRRSSKHLTLTSSSRKSFGTPLPFPSFSHLLPPTFRV